jgi:hypothetical protein
LLGRKIGPYLGEQRRLLATADGAIAGGEHALEQIFDGRARLHRAQTRRIGRGNIADQVIGEVRNRFYAGDIIGGSIHRLFVLADIGTDNAGRAAAVKTGGKALGESINASAVEPQPVDHRQIVVEPEQPRFGIAGLRFRRDRARFHKAEAQRQDGIDSTGVFVESGGKPDGIGKIQTPNAGF